MYMRNKVFDTRITPTRSEASMSSVMSFAEKEFARYNFITYAKLVSYHISRLIEIKGRLISAAEIHARWCSLFIV